MLGDALQAVDGCVHSFLPRRAEHLPAGNIEHELGAEIGGEIDHLAIVMDRRLALFLQRRGRVVAGAAARRRQQADRRKALAVHQLLQLRRRASPR